MWILAIALIRVRTKVVILGGLGLIGMSMCIPFRSRVCTVSSMRSGCWALDMYVELSVMVHLCWLRLAMSDLLLVHSMSVVVTRGVWRLLPLRMMFFGTW